MKQQIIRNIKFWGYHTRVLLLIMMGFGVGYSLLFNILWHQNVNYALTMSLIFPFVIPVSYISMYAPLVTSFGSTRKEAVFGIQIMNIISIVGLMIFNFIHYELLKDILSLTTVPYVFLLGVMILVCGLGQIAAASSLRYGYRKILWISSIIIATIAIACGIAITMLIGSGEIDLQAYNLNLIPWIVLIVGILVYVISTVVLKNMLAKYEVRYAI